MRAWHSAPSSVIFHSKNPSRDQMVNYDGAFGRQSTRDHFVEPPSILDRFFQALPGGTALLLQRLWARVSYAFMHRESLRIPKTWQEVQQRFDPRLLLNIPNAFILFWVFFLLWGERWVFQSSINACQWDKWERWVSSQFSLIMPRYTH